MLSKFNCNILGWITVPSFISYMVFDARVSAQLARGISVPNV